MSKLTVLSLKVGDLVADASGNVGSIAGFKIDGVVILWGEDDRRHYYTDTDLKAAGLVLVDGQ